MRRSVIVGDDGINPGVVMTPSQLRDLAAACAVVDPRYAAFVLTQGLVGLPPGEAQALRRRDVHPTATPATVVARATHSAAPRSTSSTAKADGAR